MTRQEWLEKFIELADGNAPTPDYRRYCRIKAQQLPRHVRRLAEYRTELKTLQAAEKAAEDADAIHSPHYAIHSVAFKEPEAECPIKTIEVKDYIEVEAGFKVTDELITALGELPKPPADEYDMTGTDLGSEDGEDTEDTEGTSEEVESRPDDL
jgi:hypothetical protein